MPRSGHGPSLLQRLRRSERLRLGAAGPVFVGGALKIEG
jgi:hypothetical protein